MYREGKNFYLQSNLFAHQSTAVLFMRELESSKVIADHTIQCNTCVYQGTGSCEEFKNLEGVYDNTDFILR